MIIDAHAHIGKINKVTYEKSKDMILRSMAKYHVSFSLISNGDANEFSSKGYKIRNQKSQIQASQETLDFVKTHPDKLGALLWCKPYFETADKTLDDFIKENRAFIYGLKFHPFGSKVAADDPRMESYYALALKYQLPILIHTATDRCSSILLFEKAAKNHPELTFIAAHMELISDNQKAIRVVHDNPNVYGDTAWVPTKIARQTIRVCGSKKLLFGTDNPVDGNETLDHPFYRSYRSRSFKKLVGNAKYEKLMGRNAIKVYKLSIKFKP